MAHLPLKVSNKLKILLIRDVLIHINEKIIMIHAESNTRLKFEYTFKKF